MTPQTGQNERTPSTTSPWKYGKIRRAPQGKERVERSESLRSLLPWPRKKPLTITIKYLGGQECWFELRARGRSIKRPGYTEIVEVANDFMRGTL